ncbi:MAG: thioredoxin domain-containing protein [Rhodospirillaceae bacterium]|nr:thioredoxin domain-containing protein [Rhodospirillaceae bacterium]
MRRLVAAVLLALALQLPAAAQPFSPDQKKAIEEIVRAYILKNPEIIREAVEALQAKEQQSAEERRVEALARLKDELAFDPGSPVLGNPTGDVTVVEFFDYRCPYCKRTAPVIDQLVKEDGRIRRVMKEFPILGPESLFASRVALAAKAQDKYEPMHRLLIAAKGALDQETVMKLAKEAGLDMAQLKRDLNSAAIDEALKKNRDLAGQLEITGTPAFIIGKEFVPGAAELDTFKTIVARARKG